MVLETDWQVEQTWGGNQPVLKGVTEIIKPEYGIECGCGFFSTPILCKNIKNLVTLEHDNKWVKKVQKEFPSDEDHQYFVQPLNNVFNATSIEDIALTTINEINSFYEAIISFKQPINFLLIDTFRCARVPAALKLAPLAEIVVLHDVRPSSREYYQYHKLDEMFKDWIRYEHRPKGFINKEHIIPWTAVYSRETLNLNEINTIVKKDSERLWNQSVGLEEI